MKQFQDFVNDKDNRAESGNVSYKRVALAIFEELRKLREQTTGILHFPNLLKY